MQRVLSIDIVRGLIVLLMLFVNDVAGVAGAPFWLKHIDPPMADGMTLPDFVLPAFLFIVGLSIPFGIETRLHRGQDWWKIWQHILLRTASLLVIGVFMVNAPASGGPLDPNLWRLLCYAGVLLVWADWRDSQRARLLRGLGAVILVGATVLYRGPSDERAFIELTPQWWGILGLIGWAYVVGCLVYSVGRREPIALAGSVGLLYSICFAGWGGMFSDWWVNGFVGISGTLGSNGALTVSGVVLGHMLLPTSRLQTHGERMRWAVLYGAGLICAAVLLHGLADLSKVFYYNKILATPPGALLTSGLVTWLWVAVYAAVDLRRRPRWIACIEPAGRHAFFIFILAPILYHLFAWSPTITGGFQLHGWLGSPVELGLLRAVGFTVLVVGLAEALARKGFRLRL